MRHGSPSTLCVMTVMVAGLCMTWPSAAAAQAQATASSNTVERSNLDGWKGLDDPLLSPAGPPANLRAGAFQPVVERMWRHSPTFRRQCGRIAAASGLTITIRPDLLRNRSDVRAFTSVFRERGVLTRAEITLVVLADAVELIAHEIEHVIEQLDGTDPSRDACGGRRARWAGVEYETCRAIEAGRRVAREVQAAPRGRTGRSNCGRASGTSASKVFLQPGPQLSIRSGHCAPSSDLETQPVPAPRQALAGAGNGLSSAVGPYTEGSGTSWTRRYTSSCPRW